MIRERSIVYECLNTEAGEEADASSYVSSEKG
jgi:hypothetical protein